MLAKLLERGPCSQNRLGRRTAMDAATIKGVVDRLGKRGLIETRPDPEDGRRLEVALSPAGQALAERMVPNALRITEETLAPLDEAERTTLIALLRRLSLDLRRHRQSKAERLSCASSSRLESRPSHRRPVEACGTCGTATFPSRGLQWECFITINNRYVWEGHDDQC